MAYCPHILAGMFVRGLRGTLETILLDERFLGFV